MPGSYIIDQTRSIVFSRVWGKLTDAELVAHARGLGTDQRFRPDFRQLADFRELTELRLTTGAVRLVVTLNPFAKTSRRAVVADSAAAFGMVRMYQLAGDLDEHFLVCKTMDEALEWVGLERTSPWPEGPVDALFHAD